jgi:hypothetical protein
VFVQAEQQYQWWWPQVGFDAPAIEH